MIEPRPETRETRAPGMLFRLKPEATGFVGEDLYLLLDNEISNYPIGYWRVLCRGEIYMVSDGYLTERCERLA